MVPFHLVSGGRGRIVDVRKGPDSGPFVMIHPVGGTVHFARRFADQMPSRATMLGIEARGVDGRDAPHASVEEMASDYVSLLRERIPQGPYRLGGPSMGGLVAYEMARQLVAAGERVALLALFDTYGPGFPARMHGSAWARSYASFVARLPARERARFLASEFTIRLGFERRSATANPAEMPRGWARTFERVGDALLDAANRYVAGIYDGDVHLFRATIDPDYLPGRSFEDRTNGFRPIVKGELIVRDVVGPHAGIFDPPYVGPLALDFDRVLSSCVDATSRRETDAR